MYDEFVKALRETDFSDGCPCGAEPMCASADCIIVQAADAIEDLEFACNRYEKDYKALCEYLPKWIPVKERLPQICTNVLVAGRMKYRWEHKYLQFVDKAYFNEGEFFETSNDWYEGQDEFEITHWMPLPEPPKEE